ncbi:MAG TPA: carboxypeptidase-like regulatory domain-containing protein [Vicinamibacterales bacterium]|nr:carboxypeptidase-like regulatory domain-containing protein [Vicinamibacterales bacterium]
MKTTLAGVLAAVLLAPQVRDVPRLPSGTAVLTGTVVVDEANGQPVRRALVTVGFSADTRTTFQTVTDDKGRFIFAGLPQGNVRVTAAKVGFVLAYYGARQAGATVGQPVALTNSQTVDITVRLPRGGVIAGTVLDENGSPMPLVRMQVQRVTTSALGERVFTPSIAGAGAPSTDDKGAYRIYGLPAGDYIVMARSTLANQGSEVRQTTTAELQWADRLLRGAGGTAAPGTDAGAPPRRSVTYASVYYPGTVNSSSAGIVSVAAGQERSGVDLRMQFVPTARIEGRVTRSGGQPARYQPVMLIPQSDVPTDQERLMTLLEAAGLVGVPQPTTTTNDGSFSIQGVEPGAYTVIARTVITGPTPGIPDAAQGQWAMTNVRVDGQDITGISLELAPGMIVEGRVLYEGRTPPAAAPRVSVSIRAATTRGVGASAPAQPLLEPNNSFKVLGLIPATYRVTATAPGWILKSAMLGGRDVADAPFEIRPGENVQDVVVTFTDSPAELSGTLFDSAGKPMSDLSIVLFSTERSMWFSGSRRVRPAVRPATDGRFTFTGLAAGTYYLAALGEVSPSDLANPQFLEQVVPAAVKVVIADGEKKTQDLRIAAR